MGRVTISISFDADEFYTLIDALKCANDATCDAWCSKDEHCEYCLQMSRLSRRLVAYESTFKD